MLSRSTRSCAVPNCKNARSLHCIPSDPNIRKAWIKFIYNGGPDRGRKNLFVCSLHFAEDSFANKTQFDAGVVQVFKIKDDAVPTILPPTVPQRSRGRSTSLTNGKSPVKKKKPLTPEARKAKRESDCRMRINIGRSFPMWRKLREQKGFKTDAELAFFLLNSVCGENPSAQGTRKGTLKSTCVPVSQLEESESDSDHQPSDEDRDMKFAEIHYEVPPAYQTDKSSQTELESDDQIKSEDELTTLDELTTKDKLKTEDQSKSKDKLDVNSVAPPLNNGNIVPRRSTSSTTTEKIKRVLPPVASSDKTSNSVTVEGRVVHEERPLVPQKPHLIELFSTCLQCGGPVLEYTTESLGSLNRLQWRCSKGHLVCLFPNVNPT